MHLCIPQNRTVSCGTDKSVPYDGYVNSSINRNLTINCIEKERCDCSALLLSYLPCSSARVTVVVSQTSEGPKYWIAPGNT